MSQTKTFYLERGPINPPELHSADKDQLIKVYASNDDFNTDLSNLDDNEIAATKETDKANLTKTDTIDDTDYRPITSNAAFGYLSEHPTIQKKPTNMVLIDSVHATTASSDGNIYAIIDYTISENGFYIASLGNYGVGGASGRMNRIDLTPYGGSATMIHSVSSWCASGVGKGLMSTHCLPLCKGDNIVLTSRVYRTDQYSWSEVRLYKLEKSYE